VPIPIPLAAKLFAGSSPEFRLVSARVRQAASSQLGRTESRSSATRVQSEAVKLH